MYHVLNRGVGRMRLFRKAADFAAMEQVLEEALKRTPVRLLAYCVLSNHWHLLLWPRGDGELSEFMRWLTLTHTQRWHANRHTSGPGRLPGALQVVSGAVRRAPPDRGTVHRAQPVAGGDGGGCGAMAVVEPVASLPGGCGAPRNP